MPTDYTIAELMAVFLARDLKDGEVLRVGVAMPVAEAAVRLAHLTHGPNMELQMSGVRMNAAHLERIPMPEFGWDRRVTRWAESYSDTGHRFDRVKNQEHHVFFIGGIQVDPYGNTNLIGIGPDYRRLPFRGPGSVGTSTLSTHVGRYHIVLNAHCPRLLSSPVRLYERLRMGRWRPRGPTPEVSASPAAVRNTASPPCA